MAADLNTVTIVGRLTREAEIRYSQAGGALVRFSIAVNRRKRTAEGNWEDEANFFDCVYFGKSAESVNQYLEKGRQVAIQGELRQSRWEQDGQNRSRVEIWVNNLQLLSSSQRQSSGGEEGYGAYQRSSAPSQNRPQYSRAAAVKKTNDIDDFGPGPESFSDDDVPF